MKKIIFLSLFLILGTGFLCAQEFSPGYLISREQDTLRGFILDGSDADLANSIQFKKDMDGQVLNYEPAALKAFAFNTGRSFESMELPPREQVKAKHIFAKNIIRGEIDLFVWRHKGRAVPDFFVYNNSSGKSAYLKKPVKRNVAEGKSFTRDQYYLGNLQLVKGETGNISRLRFSEKQMKKDIIRYNSTLQENIPLFIYKDEVKYNFDLMVGIPILEEISFPIWRISAFMNKNRPEVTRNFYFTHGIYFVHVDKKRELPTDLKYGLVDSKSSILNVMPIGFKYQGDGKVFQPYGYIGGGISAWWLTWFLIEDYNKAGSRTDMAIYPTFNIGIGTKIKMGPAAFIAEISPGMRGVFLSAGISY